MTLVTAEIIVLVILHKQDLYEMRSCLKFDILRGIEYVILAAFFGFVPVFFCLMVTVIIASVLFGTKALGPWTLWSFVPAVVINVLLLKKWVKGAYQMSGKALVSAYLFYSIIGLGMCMRIAKDR